jgi:capsular polysaccharide biosynthesis protein
MTQAVVFAAADIVIIAHGAALANAQFLGPHCAVLEITGPHFAAGPMQVLAKSGNNFHVLLDRCGPMCRAVCLGVFV